MRSIDDYTMWELVDQLRSRQQCRALVVWVDDDTGDFDPDSVDWGAVEDRCCEIGHEVIHDTGSPSQTLDTKV